MKNSAPPTSSAAADNPVDSEDDEQWGAGKLVIDLEACQEGSTNHKPEGSEPTTPRKLEPEPRPDEAVPPKPTSAVAAKDRAAKVKSKQRKASKKAPAADGSAAGSASKTEAASLGSSQLAAAAAASATASAVRKEKAASAKKKGGARASQSRDKRDGSSKGRKRKDKSPNVANGNSAGTPTGTAETAAAGREGKFTADAGTSVPPTRAAPSSSSEGPRCKRAKIDAVTTTSADEGRAPVVCQDAATDTADSQSIAVATEPECLGPCEPGTHVNLDGIVWQETTNGVLVINVTWRGKTYVGALLDATKHDWAPPRLQSESPTSDMEARAPKGRGKRRLPAAATGSACFQDINERKLRQQGRRSSLQPPPPPSPARSEASVGAANGSGKRKSSRSVGSSAASTELAAQATESAATPPEADAQADRATTSVAGSTGGSLPAKRCRTSSRCSSTNGGGGAAAAATQQPSSVQANAAALPAAQVSTLAVAAAMDVAADSSPQYIECPEPNCSKKYKHVNGLRYHQSHAHGIGGEVVKGQLCPQQAKDGLLSPPGSPPATSVAAGKDTVSPLHAAAAAVLKDGPRGDRTALNESRPDEDCGKCQATASCAAPEMGEQMEPTDLSLSAKRTTATIPALASSNAEPLAPKLEPIDFETTTNFCYSRSRRSPAEPAALTAAYSLAPTMDGGASASSVTASPPAGMSPPTGAVAQLLNSSGLHSIPASVPVAAIQPQIVKPTGLPPAGPVAGDSRTPASVSSRPKLTSSAAQAQQAPASLASRHAAPAPPKLLPRGPPKLTGSALSPACSAPLGGGVPGAQAVSHPSILSAASSLKPIQPKPTILGDLRPTVPASLSDLREQKKRDHRSDKGGKKTLQRDGNSVPLKTERKSPPPACGTSADEAQHMPRGPSAAWTMLGDQESSVAGASARAESSSCTNRLPVITASGGTPGSWDQLPKLKPPRHLGTLAAGGTENQKSPAAYSDISDDSSPERFAPAVVGTVPLAANASGLPSEDPLKDGRVCASSPKDALSCTVAPAGALDRGALACAPTGHLYFAGQSSHPIAAISPRKVISDHREAGRNVNDELGIGGSHHADQERLCSSVSSGSKDRSEPGLRKPFEEQRTRGDPLPMASGDALRLQDTQHHQQPYYSRWPSVHEFHDQAALEWAAKDRELRLSAQRNASDNKSSSALSAKSLPGAIRSESHSKPGGTSHSVHGGVKNSFHHRESAMEPKNQISVPRVGSRASMYDDGERDRHRNELCRNEDDNPTSVRKSQYPDSVSGTRIGSHLSPTASAGRLTADGADGKHSPSGGSVDLVRLSRVSPIPPVPPQHPLFGGYPFLPGFGAASFDQKSPSEAAAAAASVLRGGPFLSMPPYLSVCAPSIFVDPRMAGGGVGGMAGGGGAEQRENLNYNGASLGGGSGSAGGSSPYSGSGKGQPHKIHELEEPQAVPPPRTLSSQKSGSRSGLLQPENGCSSSSRPPSRTSPVTGTTVHSPSGTVFYSSFGNGGQGIPPFLQKQ